MTVDRLATMLGMSVDTLKAVEAGHRRLNAAELHSASLALNVPISRFYEGAVEGGSNP